MTTKTITTKQTTAPKKTPDALVVNAADIRAKADAMRTEVAAHEAEKATLPELLREARRAAQETQARWVAGLLDGDEKRRVEDEVTRLELRLSWLDGAIKRLMRETPITDTSVADAVGEAFAAVYGDLASVHTVLPGETYPSEAPFFAIEPTSEPTVPERSRGGKAASVKVTFVRPTTVAAPALDLIEAEASRRGFRVEKKWKMRGFNSEPRPDGLVHDTFTMDVAEVRAWHFAIDREPNVGAALGDFAHHVRRAWQGRASYEIATVSEPKVTSTTAETVKGILRVEVEASLSATPPKGLGSHRSLVALGDEFVGKADAWYGRVVTVDVLTTGKPLDGTTRANVRFVIESLVG